MKLKYHKNLDGIRALAALMVMFFHFFQSITPNSTFLSGIKKLSVFGQTGVTLFFVLSGFLITRILINTKNNSGYFKNFYIRRVLRIFPLYYLFLILFYFVVPLSLNQEYQQYHNKFYYFTYLQNFAITFNWNTNGPEHFWSLAVEEHFYIFWPWVIFFVSNKNLPKVILGIIIIAFLTRVIMLLNDFGVFYFTFTRFDSLAIGAFLAFLEWKGYFQKSNSTKFLILIIIIFVPTIIMWIYTTGESMIYIQVFKYLLLSITYFSIIGFVLSLKDNHPVNKLLSLNFFSYTGKISYGLYVYHPLVFLLTKKLMNSNYLIIDFCIRFFLTYLIAGLSFHFFETPFLRLKKYFDYNAKQRLAKTIQ